MFARTPRNRLRRGGRAARRRSAGAPGALRRSARTRERPRHRSAACAPQPRGPKAPNACSTASPWPPGSTWLSRQTTVPCARSASQAPSIPRSHGSAIRPQPSSCSHARPGLGDEHRPGADERPRRRPRGGPCRGPRRAPRRAARSRAPRGARRAGGRPGPSPRARPTRPRGRPRPRSRARSAAMPGHRAHSAMSRTDWCEWPGPPGTSPASEPTVDHLRALGRVVVDLLVRRGSRGSRRTSGTTGSRPASAIAPACETMSCSAMPHSKKRSGKRSRNGDRGRVSSTRSRVEGDEARLAARPRRRARRA